MPLSRPTAPSGAVDPAPVRPSRAQRAAATRRANRARDLAHILSLDPQQAGAVVLTPGVFVQAMLPHRETYLRGPDGEPLAYATGRRAADGTPQTTRLRAQHYTTTNGEFTLSIRAGVTRGPSPALPHVSRGVPFGGLARLLVCYIVTQARLRDSPTVDLGATRAAFCRSLSITPSGGDRGRLRYLDDQLMRLATAVVTFEWTRRGPGRRDLVETEGQNAHMVDAYRFWTQTDRSGAELTRGGTLTLAPRFWNEVVKSAFPIDARKAQFFRHHPLAYDLYLWLTHRLDGLDRVGQPLVALSFDQLHGQLGSHYRTDARGALTPDAKREFGRSLRHAVACVQTTWPALRVEVPRGRLVLHASRPDVPDRRR